MGQMLTRREAADYLGISVRTLDSWRVNGRIPHYRGGSPGDRLVRFKIEDLDRLMPRVEATEGPAVPSRNEPVRKPRRFANLWRRRDRTAPDDS